MKVDNAHAAQVSYKASCPLVLRYPVRVMLENVESPMLLLRSKSNHLTPLLCMHGAG